MAEGKDGQILLHKDPSSYYYQGFKVRSNNYNCTRMAFKSRRYRVQCLSNQKLLHHSQHAKNQLKSYTHPANFRVSWSKWLNPFLTTPTQKSVKSLLSFLNLQQQTKNQFILSIHSWDTVSFRVTWPDWLHPLVWIYINIQKIRLFHWFVLEIWLIRKSCNLIGWEHFGSYLRNQNLPKYGICAGT